MKSCAGCWYCSEDRYFVGISNDGAGFRRCSFIGLLVNDDDGGKCKAHRPRELGEPFQVVVDVPEPDKNGNCNPNCWLADYQARGLSFYGCKKGWCIGAKPGPGCPRWKGEGK